MTTVESTSTTTRLYGLGSLAVAGFIGGPLAAFYLMACNTVRHRSSREISMGLGFYAAASVVWLWSIFHVPPDALSQIAVHIPQVALWVFVSWLLLRQSFAAHTRSGGSFMPISAAAGIAFLFAVGIRVVLRLLFS